MYYVDPYMFAGHFYDPWPAFEYEYRYPNGYPWSGIGGGAVPGTGGGSGPGIGSGALPGFGSGALPGFGGGSGPGIGGGAVPGFGGGSGPGIGGGAVPGFGGAPQGPPPSQIPAKPQKPQGTQGAAFLVEPITIRPCLFRFTYVWLTTGRSFWFFPIILGRRSVGGFYWDPSRRRWVYFALDTNLIDVVSCSY
ncbi:hypothetical protein [Bacillus inaquosorum]|uniref:hypothetical protein n=1 Tax=Bacillus inaquosorum TaxID=483913 RepID=UPI002281DDB6|nr:hypothetical protein [Bacillus inaquosorum]MCY8871242.1 hypothetical protein [Bacillus inaquosorum]